LKMVVSYLIDESQRAFVQGRSILHDIMICQDFVNIYYRKVIS